MKAFWRRGVAEELDRGILDETSDVLDAAREELNLSYLAVTRGRRVEVETGDRSRPVVRDIELSEGVTLSVGLRSGQSVLGREDEEALMYMAPWLDEVMHTQRLVQRLAQGRSPKRISAQRTRRSGQQQTEDEAVRVDVAAVLAGLEDDARVALDGLRRFVEALQRRILGGYGLVGALRSAATTLRDPSGLRVWVEVHAPVMLPELPVSVEVAAFAISAEALNNVAWHSGSRTAEVTLMVRAGKLLIEVADHGHGAEGQPPGAGLTRMRERAEQLDGVFDFESTPHGVVVGAAMPIEPAARS